MTATDLQGVAACVRCQRSEAHHDLARAGQPDEVQRRIWKALGWPCPEYTDTLARVFAGQQARTSRWAPQHRRPAPSPALAATSSAPPVIAVKGAAAARAALQHREAS